ILRATARLLVGRFRDASRDSRRRRRDHGRPHESRRIAAAPRGVHGAVLQDRRNRGSARALLRDAGLTSRAMSGQSVRDFVTAYERACPGEVVHVREPVTLEYDVMAVVLEYERRRRWPVLMF